VAFVIVFAALAVLLLAVVVSGVKIIRPFERGLVERLGKYHATVEPGLRLIVPFIDRMARVDMRERVVDIPPQEVITSDTSSCPSTPSCTTKPPTPSASSTTSSTSTWR
jgi:regulator of protease activity HflC (stomatin/prohibitin superfamily)